MGKTDWSFIMGLFDTNPKKHTQFGYKPSVAVKILRKCADFIIFLLGLNSNNRFAIEVRQKLHSRIKVDLGGGRSALFKSDHGRLLWRAKSLFDEERMIIDWINGFKSDDVFYDIGANVGMYSVYSAIVHQKLRVFSFEPELNNVQVLYENLFMNRILDRCAIVPLAADCDTGLETFFVREFTQGGAFNNVGGEPPYNINKEKSFNMQCLTICVDDFIKLYNAPVPTKIKIDVDGNEPKVLAGMKNTLLKAKEVYIELDVSMKEHEHVFQFFQELGYVLELKENSDLIHNKDMSNYLFINKAVR
jgi:FkbM family methyltransferase